MNDRVCCESAMSPPLSPLLEFGDYGGDKMRKIDHFCLHGCLRFLKMETLLETSTFLTRLRRAHLDAESADAALGAG